MRLRKMDMGDGSKAQRGSACPGGEALRTAALFAFAASLYGCTFDVRGLPARDSSATDSRAESAREGGRGRDAGADGRMMDARMDLAGDMKGAEGASAADMKIVDIKKQDSHGTDGYVACASASLGSFLGQIPLNGTQVVGGYSFKYLGDNAAGDSRIDISCGGSYVSSGQAYPKSTNTTISVPSDGKVISVLPQFSSPAWLQVGISVKKP